MWWRRISIAKKLYLVVGVMAVLIAGELLTLRFAMHTLSAVRAFVGGEGLWSKAQKNAVYKLRSYATTHDEADYQAYIDFLRVPDGDHRAREELGKPSPDLQMVRAGFLAGRVDPEDIDSMVELLQRFYWISYLSRAIAIWGQGDELIGQLKQEGTAYREALDSRGSSREERIKQAAHRIDLLNERLTDVEERFSTALGEGSRWLERVVISLLFLAVLTVEGIGLTLTAITSRRISTGLAQLSDLANRIGTGDFSQGVTEEGAIAVASDEQHGYQDEIGQLQASVNDMGRLLQATYTKLKLSYRDLETRVQERTFELKRAKDQLEIIFDGVADGILVQDSSYRCVYANEAGAKLCGFDTARDLCEAPMEEVLKRFEIRDESGEPFPIERLPARLALQGVGQPIETVIRSRRLPEGQETWSMVKSTAIFDAGGKPYLAVSIFKDITEARKAQASERLIAEATQVLAGSLDYQSTLSNVANLAVKVLGGWCFFDLLDKDGQIKQVANAHASGDASDLTQELRAKVSGHGGPLQIIRSGQAILLSRVLDSPPIKSYMAVPLSIGRESFGSLSFVSADRAYGMHDLELARELGKRAAIAVINATLYKESQEAISCRDEYLSIASHELKTPLASLLLEVDMLSRTLRASSGQVAPTQIEAASRRCKSQVERLVALVDELMDLTRIRAGKLELSLQRCDLRRVAEEVVSQFAPQASRSGLTISLCAGAPVHQLCDPSRIRQVLTNLVSNALKYGNGSPIEIAVGENRGDAVLTVRDFGPGIPADRRNQVFERYQRATSDSKVPGLGLGLFISRQIVEAHKGGSLTLENCEGSGALFKISLPAVAGSPVALAA